MVWAKRSSMELIRPQGFLMKSCSRAARTPMSSSDGPGRGLVITQALRLGFTLHPLWLWDPPHRENYAIETLASKIFLVDQRLDSRASTDSEIYRARTRQRDALFAAALRVARNNRGSATKTPKFMRQEKDFFTSPPIATQQECMLNLRVSACLALGADLGSHAAAGTLDGKARGFSKHWTCKRAASHDMRR